MLRADNYKIPAHRQALVVSGNFMNNIMRTITTTIISLFFLTNIFGQNTDSSLNISHLTGDFYVYTTFGSYTA